MTGWRPAWAVYLKELVDALRDRRTLAVVLLSSVLMGPLVLFALSMLVGKMEDRADQRVVWVQGKANAPTLVNFFQRQSWEVKEAGPDHEARLKDDRIDDPLLIVPSDFEAELQRGDAPEVALVTNRSNRQAQTADAQLGRLLAAFNRERASLGLALLGVAPDVMTVVTVNERDLANSQARAAQLTGMLPYFVIMAVLYGALSAALDTTAGERERGSLEPLLMNPASHAALVLGKWGAVATVGMLVAVLSSLSFLPAQWLLRSDTLQSLFQYGPREAIGFLGVLIPLAAALSAALMAVAIRCRSFKEAQANCTVVLLAVSLLPMVSLFQLGGDSGWARWVPALAQHTLMNQVLRGEPMSWAQWLGPALVCLVITLAGLAAVSRRLRQAAVV